MRMRVLNFHNDNTRSANSYQTIRVMQGSKLQPATRGFVIISAHHNFPVQSNTIFFPRTSIQICGNLHNNFLAGLKSKYFAYIVSSQSTVSDESSTGKLEMNSVLENVRTDDFIEYFIYPSAGESCAGDELSELHNKLTSFVSQWTENYFWHRDKFKLHKISNLSSGKKSYD